MINGVSVSEEDKQNADVLVDLLRIRLKNHVNGRIAEESKRNDPIWEWASKNVPVCTAYMILAGHLKSNFQSMREEDSLLPADNNNFIPYTRFPNRHGVYLQHDRKLEQKIRSGKKTSFGNTVEGFSKRIAEHEKGCKAANPASNFYKLYPSKSTKRSKSNTKQRLFEDLEHVIAASFDPKGDAAQVVNCNWKEGGVMILSAQDKLRVVSSMKEKPYTEIEKFQLLMSYLFELAYDLAIAPDVNVSQSPGFESFLIALASA